MNDVTDLTNEDECIVDSDCSSRSNCDYVPQANKKKRGPGRSKDIDLFRTHTKIADEIEDPVRFSEGKLDCSHCGQAYLFSLKNAKNSSVKTHIRTCSKLHPETKPRYPSVVDFGFAVTKPGAKVREEFWRWLAKFFFETGTPFYRIENESLLKAVNVLCPGMTLPSRVLLGERLLNEENDVVKERVIRAQGWAGSWISVMIRY
jgi:hypothetical protein